MTVNGLDVSAIQQNVDWAAVSNAGYEFCVIKAGNGNSALDPLYKQNIAGAMAAGLSAMFYHVIFPLPDATGHVNRNPVDQANYHWNAISSFGCKAAADLEWPEQSQWAVWGIDANFIKQWTITYLETYSQLQGAPMILYSYPYYLLSLAFDPSITQYPLWIAEYVAGSPVIPQPWTSWYMHQISGGTTNLPGTSIPVDLDIAQDLSLF